MSQTDSQQSVIDGVRYDVYMLPPKLAMDMLVDIGKIVGPSLGTLMDANNTRQEERDAPLTLQTTIFSRAAQELFERMDKSVLRSVMDQLAQVTTADDVKLDTTFDVHFRGRLGALAKWLAFALKVQFGNFTDVLVNANSGIASIGTTMGSLSRVASTG